MTSLRLSDLSDPQRRALELLSPHRWAGTLELNVEGSTITALAHKGLVRRAWAKRPHRRLVGRLTPDGIRARDELRRRRPVEDLTDADLLARWVTEHDVKRRRAVERELERRGRARAEQADADLVGSLIRMELEQRVASLGVPMTPRDLAQRVFQRVIYRGDDLDLQRVERALEYLRRLQVAEPTGAGWRLTTQGART